MEGEWAEKGAKKTRERIDAAAGLQEIKMLQQQQSPGRKGERTQAQRDGAKLRSRAHSVGLTPETLTK